MEFEEEKTEYGRLKSHLEHYHDLHLDEYELEDLAAAVMRDETWKENVGMYTKRLPFNEREKAFHDEWLNENDPARGVNFGHGALQDLFFDRDENRNVKCLYEISKRERMVVATVIQWFGSNCGMSFLHQALARCGYRITQIPKEDEKN